MTSDVAEAEILSLENERTQALLAGDWDKLATLISDDLVHFHANGTMDGKKSYIESVSSKLDFLKIERPGLIVRVYGDTAVVTGPLNQSVRIRESDTVVDMKGVATQTWVKQTGKWLQNTFHAGRIG